MGAVITMWQLIVIVTTRDIINIKPFVLRGASPGMNAGTRLPRRHTIRWLLVPVWAGLPCCSLGGGCGEGNVIQD